MDTLTLNKLPINTCCEIYELNCKENIKRRLLDLGLICGTKITPVLISPLGDPVAYKVRGSIIALRKEDSKNIICKY